MNVFKELYQNRKLIWKLSKNDFRNKFAGAYFGIIWAFIQPMVTVAVTLSYSSSDCACSQLPLDIRISAGWFPVLFRGSSFLMRCQVRQIVCWNTVIW